jgi:hypothetical protein
MPTQNTERLGRSTQQQEQISSATNWDIKANIALKDLDSLLIAALCVIRMEEDYTDTSEEDKRQALETLMEYGRGAVSDAQEGHKELWNITAKYLFKGKSEDPKPVAETEQTDQPA